MEFKKQITGKSSDDDNGETQEMSISDNVIVMEKSFKNKRAHKGNITHLTKISDTEFMSCADDQSMKVWDYELQGCSYTYETHAPLHHMCVTGEKHHLLISSMGDGNFFVMGLEQRNQNDMMMEAHDNKIVQIVSLGLRPNLRNKYFATRCVDGDVNVWSAMEHPDRIFGLPNVDQEEQSNVQDTHRDSIKEEELPPPKEEEDKEGENLEEDEEEEYDDDGNVIPKKKPDPPPVVKKDKSNRISSDKDQMLEIKWNQTVIQESSTILCFANYREAFVNIACIDLKTQRKNYLKTLNLNASPTKIFQIDENNMLFGTEGGKIEHWKIDDASCVKIYDAHPESTAGISEIMEIKSESPLLRGEPHKGAAPESFKLLATSSFGAKEFRLWHLMTETCELKPFLKIETSIEGGIKFLLETHATQIVAANENTIKFYDFIDKNEKKREEDEQKKREDVNKTMKETFKQYIDEKVGMKLNQSNLLKYFAGLAEKLPTPAVKASAAVSEECYDDVWYEMDFNETGYITWHQVKAFIARIEKHEEELKLDRERLEKIRQEKMEEQKRLEVERQAQQEAEEAQRLAAEAEEEASAD